MEAAPERERATDRLNRIANWRRWWLAGTALDWGFCLLSAGLVAAGYYESYLTRTFIPAPKWAAVPVQVAWFAVTAYLAATAFLAWRRDGRLRSVIPDGYSLSVAGCAIFLVGILINGWWSDAFGPDYGVPAIFRLPNLIPTSISTPCAARCLFPPQEVLSISPTTAKKSSERSA